MQSHRHVLHHIRVYTNNLHLHPGDRLTLLASYGFDAAVMDLFGALLNGATLYPFDLKKADPAALWMRMKQHAITIYHSTPTVYRYWIDGLRGVPTLPGLRLIVLGGEAATRADFEAYQQHFGPNCLFVNGLGPTESTVSLQFVTDRSTRIIGQTVPVGYPVENTEIVLLNQDGKETDIYGEIAIRSPYVAVGYWQQPELTRHAFEAPTETRGTRLYRTGDMGRRRSDGSLEFMGRKDTQVKIRGYRIELGEIETALAQHHLVKKAVVLHRDDGPAGPYLVGYLLTSRDTSVSPEELRSFLSERLPAYMVPSVWMELDAFPLTPNGKVDRKALPAPDRNRSQPAETLVAPRDESELQLAKIWEKVLGIRNIGMEDNFFDLGGHSLLAVRLFTEVEKVFGKNLPMMTLFQAPTVGQLAGIIRQEGFTTPWSSLAPIKPGGSKPPFFCVHGCTGRVLHLYDLGRLLGPEQPFYGLSALGFEKGQVLHTQIEEMAAHYIKEIQTIQSNGPYFIGGAGFGCTIVLEMAHQLESQGQDLGLIVLLTPSPLKPNVTHTNLDTYGRLLRKFDIYGRLLRKYWRLVVFHLKSRPLIPALYNAFSNRVLWHFKIFHRFIPIEIYRWRRFISVFIKARMNHEPEAYQGRISCILRDEYAHNPKKGIGDWSDIAVGGLDVRFVPGDIFTMWKEPHVQILADQLTDLLRRGTEGHRSSPRKQSAPTDVADAEIGHSA